MTDFVWVSPQLVTPPRSGADLRTHRLLSHLASQAPVTVVVAGRCEGEATRRATGAVAVEVMPRAPTKIHKGMHALTRAWPTDVAAAWSAPAADAVRRRVAGGATVIADHLQMAPYLPHEGHVLSTHNADHQYLQETPTPRAIVHRAARRWDILATGVTQRRALAHAGLVVAVSQRDADLLRPDALVVPNGADIPRDAPPVPPDGLTTFVGALTYAPNSDAVAWWVDEVWPHLPATTMPLTVIGLGPDSVASRFAGRDGVDLIGEVDDVGPWLARTSVVAVPLLHGSGTRLKVLEAMAWGRPIVATAKGVEGLPVVNGEHALIVDDPGDFADAVCRLRMDHTMATRLASNGRALAETFSWERIAPAFTEAVMRQHRSRT